jgi:hypothetical protein
LSFEEFRASLLKCPTQLLLIIHISSPTIMTQGV